MTWGGLLGKTRIDSLPVLSLAADAIGLTFIVGAA